MCGRDACKKSTAILINQATVSQCLPKSGYKAYHHPGPFSSKRASHAASTSRCPFQELTLRCTGQGTT